MFKVTASPVAKVSVPLSASVRFAWIGTRTLGPTVTAAPLLTVKLPAKT